MTKSASNSGRSRSNSAGGRGREKEDLKQSTDANTCLYIGNIDKRIGNDKLRSQFEQFGPMEYCYIVYEPQSAAERGSRTQIKQSRGYGFAKYLAADDAQKAYLKLNGMQLNGRKLNLEFSKRPTPRDKTPGRYLGKKRPSPERHQRNRRSSRSSSGSGRKRRERKRSHSRSSSESPRRRRVQKKKNYRSRSREYRRRSSYSRSPRH